MEQKPTYEGTKFNCPQCAVVSQQNWFTDQLVAKIAGGIIHNSYLNNRGEIEDYQQRAIEEFIPEAERDLAHHFQNFFPSNVALSTCISCGKTAVWVDKQMVHPKTMSIDPPNEDLDDKVRALYLEAASIHSPSPRGAAALLRLALQQLLKQVGKTGKDINSDIGELVAEGLSPRIQKALDVLRVVGNNAVHPGQISLDDNPEIAQRMFTVLNVIGNELITRPRELEAMYDNVLPEGAKQQIEKRDNRSNE